MHIQPGLLIYEVSEAGMMTICPQHDMNGRLSLYKSLTLSSLMCYHQLPLKGRIFSVVTNDPRLENVLFLCNLKKKIMQLLFIQGP